jgi:hypothetical protein
MRVEKERVDDSHMRVELKILGIVDIEIVCCGKIPECILHELKAAFVIDVWRVAHCWRSLKQDF